MHEIYALVLVLAVLAFMFLFDYLCEEVDPLAGLGLLALIVGPVLVFEIAKNIREGGQTREVPAQSAPFKN